MSIAEPLNHISLSNILKRLKMCGWYWGDISSLHANELLRNARNGSFIVRDSSDAFHLFTLSLKTRNIVVSVRVAYSRGHFKLDSCHQEDCPSFRSVVDLIDYYLEDETRKFYIMLPEIGKLAVALKHPVWKEVPSLQHVCRYKIIRCCQTVDRIRALPLPTHLLWFVEDFAQDDAHTEPLVLDTAHYHSEQEEGP